MAHSRAGVFFKGKCIAKIVKVCDTPASRQLGLMFQDPLRAGDAYFFVMDAVGILSTTIHMWFVRAPIDVVWLDGTFGIVDIVQAAPPARLLNPATWRTYGPRNPAKYVLEMAEGSVERAGVSIGDRLEVKLSSS